MPELVICVYCGEAAEPGKTCRGCGHRNMPTGMVTRSMPAGPAVAERATLVDVSKYQGEVNVPALLQAGFCGVIARCTIGWGYYDPFYAATHQSCIRHGAIFGGYHVLYPRNQAPAREAAYYLTRRMEGGDGRPPDFDVIDVELHPEQDVLGQAYEWLTTVENETGRIPWNYTGSWFWDRLSGSVEWAKHFPLIEAEYITLPTYKRVWEPSDAPMSGGPRTLARGYTEWGGWQWTSSGRPVGVQSASLDYDVLNMTVAEFRTRLGLTPPPLSVEERLANLEDAARAHGWAV